MSDSSSGNDPRATETSAGQPKKTGKQATPLWTDLLKSLAIGIGFLASSVLMLVPMMAVLLVVLVAFHFPRHADDPFTPAELAEQESYYEEAYENQAEEETAEAEDSRYVEIAAREAEKADVDGELATFVQEQGLEGAKALDVGAGRGYLQDIVDDYTGLDISSTSRRFFHKPFVQASATAMPFDDNTFDLEWTVWVMEHVPNPEAALAEMRRTVKDGGILYLRPAWNVTTWAANGYYVRPYSDFGLGGKFLKTLLPFDVMARLGTRYPIRVVRYLNWQMDKEPTSLRYNPLEPNYETYWMADSDAINSIDRYETELWFLSRGDECLNCEGDMEGLASDDPVLIIRVHKGGADAASPELAVSR